MRAAVVSALVVALMFGTVFVSAASASASVADKYLILGSWEHKTTDGDEVTTVTYTFKTGGSGTYRYEYSSDASTSDSETEIEWEINDDGHLVVRHVEGNYEMTYDYEFSKAYTKLTLKFTGWSSGETDYEKKGSVCGVCCPFPFMLFVIAPVGALLLLRKRKGH